MVDFFFYFFSIFRFGFCDDANCVFWSNFFFNVYHYSIVLVIYFPFVTFFIGTFFGRSIGTNSIIFISIFNLVSSLILSIFYLKNFHIVYDIYHNYSFSQIFIGPLFSSFPSISWLFLIDSFSVSMCIVVCLISLMVHIYSIEYMNGDPHLDRFFCYLSLFTGFMLIFVFAGNFIVAFVGWEGIGLMSYLLISFWHTRIQACKSALKAVLYNRVGDIFFFIGAGFFYSIFNSFDYSLIIAVYNESFSNVTTTIFGSEFRVVEIIAVSFVIAAMAKSAQFGLHAWLPDAMEGPTPVSALIHAATMVTAGVILLIRCGPIISSSVFALNFLSIIGAITALFGATAAIFQMDLKRIIAYSTCSQLGYMVSICGSGAFTVSFYHLVNHAFFKALLFLAAGAIIHSLDDEQDIRKMGGLATVYPFYFIVMLVGSLSLVGFPFFTGYYSKEFIIVSKFAFADNSIELFSAVLLIISAICTAIYSARLICVVFFREYSGFKKNIINVHSSSFYIAFPLVVLSFFSIFFGYFASDAFIGIGSDFFINSIYDIKSIYSFTDRYWLPIYPEICDFFLLFNIDYYPVGQFLFPFFYYEELRNYVYYSPSHIYVMDFEFIDVWIKLFPSVVSIFFFIVTVYFYNSNFVRVIKQKIVYNIIFRYYFVKRIPQYEPRKFVYKEVRYDYFIKILFSIYKYFFNKWEFDTIVSAYFIKPFFYFANKMVVRDVEKGVIDYFGPTFIYNLFKYFGNFFNDFFKKHNLFWFIKIIIISMFFIVFAYYVGYFMVFMFIIVLIFSYIFISSFKKLILFLR